MKVCFITHAFPPAETAAASYSKIFVDELIKNDVEVAVITSRRNNSAPLFEEFDGLSVYRIDFQMPIFMDYFEFMAKVPSALKKVYEREDFELIHSEHLFPAPYAGKFAKKRKLPHVVTIEGVSKVSSYSKMLFEMHKLLLPRINYDTLVSWGRFVLNEYFLKWGVNKEKSTVIPGAVDINQFSPEVSGEDIRKELPEAERLIITAKPMYLTNALGIGYIIKAMKIVSQEHKNCKLLIGGMGRMYNKLVNLTHNQGLKNYVKFLGWIPQNQMPEYYRAADMIVDSIIFSHPGSITVLESLATGVPNVLSKIECLPGEINIPPEDIALLTKPADPESIARGIITLLEDEKLGRKIGSNARKFVYVNFSPEKIVKSYLDIYSKLTT